MTDMSNYAEETWPGEAVNATVTKTCPDRITYRAHVFIGLTWTTAGVAGTPGAGTFSITVETKNNPGVFQPVPSATSVAATGTNQTFSVAANVTKVRVVSSGITTTDGVTISVTANGA